MNTKNAALTLLLITAHALHAMNQRDLYGNDPFRFGEINIQMPSSEAERIQAEHLDIRTYPDTDYHRTRSIIARAIRLGRNPNEFKSDTVLKKDYWLMKDLLEHGVNPNEGIDWDSNPPRSLGDPLFFYAYSVPMAQLMIQHGASVRTKGQWGNVLHYSHSSQFSPAVLAYYCNTYHTQLLVNDQEAGRHRLTPLQFLIFFWTVHWGKDAITKAKILIAAGTNLRAQDANGKTAYDLATENNDITRKFAERAELLAILNPDAQPVLAASRPLLAPDARCSICLDHLEFHTATFLPCAHVFHTTCINPWRMSARTCPLCRVQIP